MITFDFTYSENFTIIFDDILSLDFSGSMNDAIEKVKWGFDNYPFEKADVINANTGEIIFIAYSR